MNDDHVTRDPALDAWLGAHSSDTPPAHLDAAILAAAHRAVGSGPRPARATHAWRWWMPLAAAAVIGVMVVGVLPLAPSIVNEPASTISDVPAGASSVPEEGPHADAFRPPVAPNNRAPLVPASPPPSPAARPDSETPSRAPAKVTKPVPKVERPGAVPAERAQERKAADETSTARNRLGSEAGALRPPPGPSAAAAADGNPASAPSFARRPESPPAQGAPSADSLDASAARPHTVDEWIGRLRALRARGDIPEATRALADFRRAWPDADARLPADLREWANALPRAGAQSR